ncbi:hypothetical protein DV737_g134, partial [Chaetothyriales sp. CBS 132003]
MGSLPPPVPPATMPLISPAALLHAHLSQTPPLRPSRRQPTEPRPIDLNVGALTHTQGSALVRIGATTIVCGVRAEILPVADIPSYRAVKKDKWGEEENGSNDDDGSDDDGDGDDGDGDDGDSDDGDGDDGDSDDGDGDDDDDDLRVYRLVVPNLELSTGCSPLHPANAAPSVEAQSISQRLLSLLHSSRLVRQADLEVSHTLDPVEVQQPGLVPDGPRRQLKAFWVLYVDMVCLSHGGSGSVFDAAWLAMYAALRHTRLPKAVWDADAKQVFCSPDVREATALRLRGMPVPLSFGVFVPAKTSVPDEQVRDEAARWLVDLDAFEEETVAEVGCVVVDADDAGDAVLHRVEKSGGAGRIGLPEIRALVGIAKARRSQWQRVLHTASPEAG